MPRILISAFSCGPNHGSEPGVGWNTVLELAKEPTNELWVIVEPSWEEKINAHLARHPLPNVHFLFLGNRSLSKLMCTTLTQSVSWNSYYYMWQFVHVPEMRRLHEQVRFDLAQHVTYVKLSVPSMLGFLGLPFIWGPVGGAETAPACFFTETGWKNRLYEFLRGTMLALTVWNPFVRLTARRSTLAYGVTRESADALRACGATNVLTRPAVALSDEELAALTVRTTPSDLTRAPRLLYVGNLIPLKGVHLALRALAASGCTDTTAVWPTCARVRCASSAMAPHAAGWSRSRVKTASPRASNSSANNRVRKCCALTRTQTASSLPACMTPAVTPCSRPWPRASRSFASTSAAPVSSSMTPAAGK